MRKYCGLCGGVHEEVDPCEDWYEGAPYPELADQFGAADAEPEEDAT